MAGDFHSTVHGRYLINLVLSIIKNIVVVFFPSLLANNCVNHWSLSENRLLEGE